MSSIVILLLCILYIIRYIRKCRVSDAGFMLANVADGGQHKPGIGLMCGFSFIDTIYANM